MEQFEALSNPAISNRDLVERWYSDHRRSLYALCLAYLKNPQEAEEAVQETFIKALKKVFTFRGDSEPITWLRRIAVNVCLDRVRSVSWKWLRKQVPLESTIPASETPRPEIVHQLDQGLKQLSPQQRMVVVLRFYEDLSLEEIGTVTGLHTGTVKRHLYRALDRLRKIGGIS